MGALFALLADGIIVHGVGTAWFIAGLIVLAMGLLGATEPPEGWRKSDPGRRSIAARVALDHPDVQDVTSLDLLVWGLVVGGATLALAMVALSVAQG